MTNAGMDALADPTRRAIFERLAEGPQAVGELANHLPVSPPAVSQHLQVLKQAGLVTDRAEGTRRLYQLDPQGGGAVRMYFERFWTQALASFQEAVEKEQQTPGRPAARSPSTHRPSARSRSSPGASTPGGRALTRSGMATCWR